MWWLWCDAMQRTELQASFVWQKTSRKKSDAKACGSQRRAAGVARKQSEPRCIFPVRCVTESLGVRGDGNLALRAARVVPSSTLAVRVLFPHAFSRFSSRPRISNRVGHGADWSTNWIWLDWVALYCIHVLGRILRGIAWIGLDWIVSDDR